MRMLIALLAVLVSFSAVHAQDQEEVRVTQAANAFIRDSVPKGFIAIDGEALRADPAVADQIAREMNAARVRIRDVAQCEEPRPRGRRSCTLGGYTAVIAFSRPVIQNGSAQMTVSWWYTAAAGRVAQRSMGLVLVRGAKGEWQVAQVSSRGMS